MDDELRSPHESIPFSAKMRIDEICLKFEGEWQSESPPRIEDYLSDFAGLDPPVVRIVASGAHELVHVFETGIVAGIDSDLTVGRYPHRHRQSLEWKGFPVETLAHVLPVKIVEPVVE